MRSHMRSALQVLYSKDLVKKRKRWDDGVLCVAHGQATLLSDTGDVLASDRLPSSEQLHPGRERVTFLEGFVIDIDSRIDCAPPSTASAHLNAQAPAQRVDSAVYAARAEYTNTGTAPPVPAPVQPRSDPAAPADSAPCATGPQRKRHAPEIFVSADHDRPVGVPPPPPPATADRSAAVSHGQTALPFVDDRHCDSRARAHGQTTLPFASSVQAARSKPAASAPSARDNQGPCGSGSRGWALESSGAGQAAHSPALARPVRSGTNL